MSQELFHYLPQVIEHAPEILSAAAAVGAAIFKFDSRLSPIKETTKESGRGNAQAVAIEHEDNTYVVVPTGASVEISGNDVHYIVFDIRERKNFSPTLHVYKNDLQVQNRTEIRIGRPKEIQDGVGVRYLGNVWNKTDLTPDEIVGLYDGRFTATQKPRS